MLPLLLYLHTRVLIKKVTVQSFCRDCGNWTLFSRNSASPRYIITPDYEMYFVKEIVQANASARPR